MELFKFCRSAFSRIVLVIVVDHDPRRGVSLYPCIGGNGGPSAQYLIALGIWSTNARGVTVGPFSFISMSPASPLRNAPATARSEEHTSELQSRFDLVCRLLLEK